MKAIKNLLQVKEQLDADLMAPGLDINKYCTTVDLITESIDELRTYCDIGPLAEKFEACLDMTHPDGVDPRNQYERARTFINELPNEDLDNISASNDEAWFNDPDVITMAVKIEGNGLTSIYKIPYDKQYTVIRGAL